MGADVNLLSFNGPAWNGRTYDSLENLDGTGFDDTVKCSTRLQNFTGRFGSVISGREDTVDINNLCRDISLSAKLWTLRNCQMGFTVKGGTQDAELIGPVIGHGRQCDIDIGNASDQSHAWTVGVVLNLWTLDGSKLRIRVLGGDLPMLVPGSGPYTYVFPWKSLLLRKITIKTFLEIRRWGLLRQS